MSRVIQSREEWAEFLKREYPGVRFHESQGHPPGVNAVTSGVMVGRYHSQRHPPFGVVYDQPRSCGGHG